MSLPLRMSLKLLLIAGGKSFTQRKHVEPWRQGKQVFVGSPKVSESCKLYKDRFRKLVKSERERKRLRR